MKTNWKVKSSGKSWRQTVWAFKGYELQYRTGRETGWYLDDTYMLRYKFMSRYLAEAMRLADEYIRERGNAVSNRSQG